MSNPKSNEEELEEARIKAAAIFERQNQGRNDELIRKDAAAFLAAMLSAGALAAEDDRMIQRAITLAKKLHEYC